MKAFTSVKEIGRDTTEPYSDIRAALFRTFAPRDAKDRIKNVRPETLVDKTTARLLGIQENDLWIAAIAVQYNLFLVSGDRMSRIPEVWSGLRLVRWRTTL